ncbi:MAG TPA: response regulator [Burkholderiales bacterium]|nr:response regulator [Burkholderiales bacterium]
MPNEPDHRRDVLVVDNHADAREQAAAVLSSYRVSFASNAYEAMRETNAKPFHAYILEQWLPDWSGVQLCRAIRGLDPHAPILFVTAAARDEDRSRALRAGANAYLSKPVDGERLLRQLRMYLELSELESLRAKQEEERAVQDELVRRARDTIARADAARQLAAKSIERTARTKAYKAFIDARGSRAHFESWWPNVFGSASANAGIPRTTE